MSTRTSHNSEASLFYITFTCYQWLPLFESCYGYDLVDKWLNVLKEKPSIKTTAYTIMPSHVHAFENYDLNKIMSNGKRFMAYELIKRLQERGLSKILLQLKEGLTERDVAKGQKRRAPFYVKNKLEGFVPVHFEELS